MDLYAIFRSKDRLLGLRPRSFVPTRGVFRLYREGSCYGMAYLFCIGAFICIAERMRQRGERTHR